MFVLIKYIAVVIVCDRATDRRNFMYTAHKKGMTGPEWVYIYYTLLPGNDEITPWIHSNDVNVTVEEMEFRKAAFMSFKQVSCETKERWIHDSLTHTQLLI